MSAARPLPSATTTGIAGFLVTDSKTVRMVLGPPSSTSSTTGTPWVRSVKPTVKEHQDEFLALRSPVTFVGTDITQPTQALICIFLHLRKSARQINTPYNRHNWIISCLVRFSHSYHTISPSFFARYSSQDWRETRSLLHIC